MMDVRLKTTKLRLKTLKTARQHMFCKIQSCMRQSWARLPRAPNFSYKSSQSATHCRPWTLLPWYSTSPSSHRSVHPGSSSVIGDDGSSLWRLTASGVGGNFPLPLESLYSLAMRLCSAQSLRYLCFSCLRCLSQSNGPPRVEMDTQREPHPIQH